MKEEEVLYYLHPDNTVTAIIYYKSNRPLAFIKKKFIGFNQTVITTDDFNKINAMRPETAKDYFIQLWSKYNKNYELMPDRYPQLWTIRKIIGEHIQSDVIVINTDNQRIYFFTDTTSWAAKDIEITQEEYDTLHSLYNIEPTLAYIQAINVYTEYTGDKTLIL